MDATTLVIANCYDSFFERMERHFRARHLIIRLTGEEIIGKRTRTFQYFTMHVHPNPNKLIRHNCDDLRIAYECKYNLTGDLHLHIKLSPYDPFAGAADFDSKRAEYVYYVDSIIRSFSDASYTSKWAIFKV
jgi:hypothetical protein